MAAYDTASGRVSDDFLPDDFDTEERYGGWGGHEYHGTEAGIEQNPIVFVHGNTGDASHFDMWADRYMEAEYSGDELWAITFDTEGPSHDAMAEQLDSFVGNVCDYTGADQVDIVSHSLGVTGTRYWMDQYDAYDAVDTFVGIAGANHGTYLSDVASQYGLPRNISQPFVSTESARNGPLNELNHPGETPGDVSYYTIRGGNDECFTPMLLPYPPFYLADNRDSPVLDGAEENVLLEDADHMEVKDSPSSQNLVYKWLTK